MTDNNGKTMQLLERYQHDSQGRLSLLLMSVVGLCFVLALFLGYVIVNPPQPQYFATSVNGRITPLVALEEPNQSDSAVLQWANQAAIAAFTYNFVNYRDELLAASRYFTATGWQQFTDALSQSNNLDVVKAKKLIVSAVATRSPIILQKGVLNGVYSWRIQMPILVTYQSASEFSQQNNVVTMLVTRISTLESARGIGISQFIVMPATGGLF